MYTIVYLSIYQFIYSFIYVNWYTDIIWYLFSGITSGLERGEVYTH